MTVSNIRLCHEIALHEITTDQSSADEIESTENSAYQINA